MKNSRCHILAVALAANRPLQYIKVATGQSGRFIPPIYFEHFPWATKFSIERFAKFAKLSAAPSNPDTDFLDTPRGKTDRV
jgi:hypothetical protein